MSSARHLKTTPATPRMKKTAAHWKSVISAATEDVEAHCQRLGIPVIYGSFSGAHATSVRVAEFDWAQLVAFGGDGSICILDLVVPPAPVDKDPELRDLHIYLRLRSSDTWLCTSVESPEEDDPDEIPEDELDYPWQREHSIDEKTMDGLAVRVAKDIGFGGLKNKGERVRFVQSVLQDTTPHKLVDHDFWEISRRAETFFRIGIAPTTAKQLESEGKSTSEIARIMGISRNRVLTAIETNVPRHVEKLLNS